MASDRTIDKITIVVVEDEAMLLLELAEGFLHYGFHVFAAGDATEALEILREQASSIQAVFTDVHLPSPMNGLMLGRQIRQTWPWIALLVTSGYGKPDAADMPQGCRFVLKPYRIGRIAEQIREMIVARPAVDL